MSETSPPSSTNVVPSDRSTRTKVTPGSRAMARKASRAEAGLSATTSSAIAIAKMFAEAESSAARPAPYCSISRHTDDAVTIATDPNMATTTRVVSRLRSVFFLDDTDLDQG